MALNNIQKYFVTYFRRTVQNYTLQPNVQNLSKIYIIRTFSKQSTNCWKCQKLLPNQISFVCDFCKSLQDVNKNLDYFTILSLPNDFTINSKQLTNTFRSLQGIVHPDKYSQKSDREQMNSKGWSALINKAYKTLQTPLERGEYLLKMNGIEMPKDNSSLDKTFLMEMMERNEEVEEADAEELNVLLEKVQADLSLEVKELENVFKINNYESAKFILVKMKYLKSLELSIKDKLQKLLGH